MNDNVEKSVLTSLVVDEGLNTIATHFQSSCNKVVDSKNCNQSYPMKR